jgi:ribonuclease D
MPDYSMIERIDEIAAELSQQSLLGLDTEFMREKTFFAELCLVQVSAGKTIYCVDPLADLDMPHFWDSVMQTGWVVHSARQDIEVIYQAANRMPTQLFDTQVAAGLLGYAPQLGYAGLVSELFDVEIPKSHTRADWSKRPLADAVLEYAAEDVEYLLPAREILAERLEQQGRLEWANEDSALLLNPALYDIDPALAINRMKGARNMHGQRRAAAARLAAWREEEALRANRPRQWIAKDSALLDIASRSPKTVAELEQIDGLPASLVRRSGDQLIDAVAAADGDDTNYRPPSRPDEEQKMLLKKMQQDVAACADDLGLAAETVASKKELSAVIIGGNRDSRVFSGWRADVIGNSLQKLF